MQNYFSGLYRKGNCFAHLDVKFPPSRIWTVTLRIGAEARNAAPGVESGR